MMRATKLLFLLLVTAAFLLGGCGVLKKNSCGCPPIPANGAMKH